MISGAELRQLEANLHRLTPAQQAHVLGLIEERDRLALTAARQDNFIDFVKAVWPGFIPGAHHNIMAEAFERVARGELKRLIINIAPRHSKSELGSVLLPAWFLGRNPRKKVIQVCNTADLAVGFGRRVRNLVGGEELDDGHDVYHDIFPGTQLSEDSQAAYNWHTSKGAEYFAVGVNGKVTGKGADLAIVDDPHSEQEAKQAESRPEIYDDVYAWYTSGIRQRLQPGGSIVVIMTRWGKRDLTGQLLRRMESRDPDSAGDIWEVIELPALLDEDTPNERPMWPGFWSLAELRNTRAELPPSKWKAQYQQQPTSEQAAILKREYWRVWGEDTANDIQAGRSSCPGPNHRAAWNAGRPPACKYILQSWDCANTKNSRSNFNACTTWGVFDAEDPNTGKTINHIILLNAWRKRMEFPELKEKARTFYLEDSPDTLLIESKAAGVQLIQEFRAMGIPVEDFGGSSRGGAGISNDKIARANSIADVFKSGYVWAPPLRSAEEVIDECAEFPAGEYDDYVDSTVQAMIRFRAGGLVRTEHDEADDEEDHVPYRRRRMY